MEETRQNELLDEMLEIKKAEEIRAIESLRETDPERYNALVVGINSQTRNGLIKEILKGKILEFIQHKIRSVKSSEANDEFIAFRDSL